MRLVRRRSLALVVVVVALLGLLLAVDRVGAYAASRATAHEIRDQGAGQANVRILGFPFLTQLARADLQAVTISERHLAGNGVTLDDLYATGYGVHVSPAAALHGRVAGVRVDRVAGTAVLTYAGLSRSLLSALGVSSAFSLTLTPAGDGAVEAHLSGPLGLSLAQQVPVPTVAGGRLQLGGFVQRFVRVLPAGVANDLTVALPSLPYGLTLSGAVAQPDGLHFAVTGRDVTLR